MTPFAGFTHLRPLDGMRLEVGFADDSTLYVVDVGAIVGDDPFWAPLHNAPVFAGAHRVAGGTGLTTWRSHHGLSSREAAGALGLLRRQVAYDASGQKPMRAVMLVCRGWKADQAA